MICEGCIFYKEDRERGIDICGRRDEPFEAIRACIRADYYEACLQKMDKEAVKGLVLNVAKAENERDEALRTLAKVDEHINILNRLLSDYRNNLKRS